MIHCKKCDTEYDKYEGNYWKKEQSKTGYGYICKHCEAFYFKNWQKKFNNTKNWYNLVVAVNSEPITKRKSDSILAKVNIYEKKIRWQEEQFFITDIKLCEI